MGDQHRLGRAEMRERRHQRVARRRGLRGQCVDDARHRALQQRNAAAQIQAQIQRHLLVARPARVQTAAGVAEALDQQPLDEAVDVLVRAVDECRIGSPLVEHGGERVFDLTRFVRRQHAGLRQRARPRHAAGHIVFEEAAIETERRAELRALAASGANIRKQPDTDSSLVVGRGHW